MKKITFGQAKNYATAALAIKYLFDKNGGN